MKGLNRTKCRIARRLFLFFATLSIIPFTVLYLVTSDHLYRFRAAYNVSIPTLNSENPTNLLNCHLPNNPPKPHPSPESHRRGKGRDEINWKLSNYRLTSTPHNMVYCLGIVREGTVRLHGWRKQLREERRRANSRFMQAEQFDMHQWACSERAKECKVYFEILNFLAFKYINRNVKKICVQI